MNPKFKPGEIVIIQNDPQITFEPELKRLEGEEVEIIAPARHEPFCDGVLFCHLVRHASYGEFYAAPHELRRKRPPTTGEDGIMARFKAPPVEHRDTTTAWQAQYDTAQALMAMGVRVRPGKWLVEVV
jgi:hypothetical protein